MKKIKKPVDAITLDDMKHYPIWVFDYENESEEEGDETWQIPVTNSTDVTKDMCEAYIYLRTEDFAFDLSACIDIEKLTLEDLCFWDSVSNGWVPVEQIDNYQSLTLVAVPSVLGKPDMKFGYNENRKSFISVVEMNQLSVWDKIKRIFSS